MRKIREVLRLRDEHGASQRQIVAGCRLPRSTVRDYLRRLRAAGLTHAAMAGAAARNRRRRLGAVVRHSRLI